MVLCSTYETISVPTYLPTYLKSSLLMIIEQSA